MIKVETREQFFEQFKVAMDHAIEQINKAAGSDKDIDGNARTSLAGFEDRKGLLKTAEDAGLLDRYLKQMSKEFAAKALGLFVGSVIEGSPESLIGFDSGKMNSPAYSLVITHSCGYANFEYMDDYTFGENEVFAYACSVLNQRSGSKRIIVTDIPELLSEDGKPLMVVLRPNQAGIRDCEVEVNSDNGILYGQRVVIASQKAEVA